MKQTTRIHLIKLVVGVNDMDAYADIQRQCLVDYHGKKANPVWTRHTPRRADELLNGGSIYRVIKNKIQFRQNILGFEKTQHPQKGTMCLILCDPVIIRTTALPKRPFQGWRYLKPADAPPDIGIHVVQDNRPPPDMEDELELLGLL